jgi:hypothetical protein
MIHIHSKEMLLGDCLAQLPFMCAVSKERGDRVHLTGEFNPHISPLLEPTPIVFEPGGSGIGEKPTTSGLFADHNIALYAAGAQKLKPLGVPVEIDEAATRIARLYTDATGWDWINPINGRYWAMKIMPSGAKSMIRRGSVTVQDWLDDSDAIQIPVMGARMSQGFWAGVQPIESVMDQQLA